MSKNTYSKELVDVINDTTKYIDIFVTIEPALLCYPRVQLQITTVQLHALLHIVSCMCSCVHSEFKHHKDTLLQVLP